MRVFKILILTLFVFSCKNDKTSEITDSAESKTNAEYYFVSVFRETLELVPGFVASGISPDTLVRITTSANLEDDTYPKLIKVDFGSLSQTNSFGITRRGVVLVNIEQKDVLKSPFTIEFRDFYFNDTRLLGTIESSYSQVGTRSNYDLFLRDSSKCANANGTMSFNGSITLQQTFGENSITVLDDIYTYSEDTKGQDFLGRSYESKGDGSVDFSCKYLFASGTGSFTANQEESLNYNYVSSCSGIVELTNSNDETLFFQLK